MLLKTYVQQNKKHIQDTVKEIYDVLYTSIEDLMKMIEDDEELFFEACEAGVTDIQLSGYSVTDKNYLTDSDYITTFKRGLL